MEGYEDDDDTHFCIKCNLTIHGLDNYVRHRRSGCRPPDDKNETVHESPSTPTTVSYPEILNADAFFSSLELQSSAKSNLQRAPSLLESSRKYKKDDARKKGQKGQMDVDETAAKDKLHSILPTVGDLDDPIDHLCIQSLVFPDIVVPSSGKNSSTVTQGKFTQSMPQTSSNMDGTGFPVKHEPETSLASLMTDVKTERKRQESAQRIESDHQTSWLVEDTILVDLSLGNSENKELARYDFGYQLDNDFEDDMLDDDLGDDDSYSDSDDDESRERLPRGHTGGKWKPGLGDLPQDMPHMHEDDVDPEDDHQEHSLPAYTGGKWKPTKTAQKVEEYESKDTSGQPPPGYTRGKWVPGARADIESGYWCNPCGRKLASRLVYNRHLLSDLHARRSIREIDGGFHLPRGMDPHADRRVSTRRQAASFAKRVKEEPEQKEVKKGDRRREKKVLTCEMCRARVRRPQIGKHLLSHYHCCVAGVNPCSPSARRFLLENMANVVRQCPFQCAPCRFYCNTEDTFLLHWRSDLHVRTFGQVSGSCRCTPCDFWCEDSGTLESHLLSTSHRDMVSMINGSVPVVISRQRALPCGGCDRQFRYNLQLRLHARETGHIVGDTASDDYQLCIRCDMCPKIVRSLVSLQRHQLSCHVADNEAMKGRDMTVARPAPYFCSFCSMNFTTPQEAVLHRRTSTHKEVVKAHKSWQGASGKSMARDCPHCDEKQPSLTAHKNHLLFCHAELCHRCPRCGTLFALSQDVTRHTRGGNCTEMNGESNAVAQTTDAKKEWRCNDCVFSTDSQAEFIFHEALHAGAIEMHERTIEDLSNRSLPKYQCPVCKKIFTKVSLRNHIRQHTGEKPFPCAKCSLSFSRRSDLNVHQRMYCNVQSSELDMTGRQRSFVCSECTEGFYTKHALRQHTLRHAGKQYKCGLPGCPTILRTASELKTHRMLVHDSVEKHHSCPDCSYAAKTKTQLRRHRTRHGDTADDPRGQRIYRCGYIGCDFKTKLSSHLRRHMRLHTGSKPYKCRHCSYASNNLENLRKHVLLTSLHPGKTIYECDFCEIDTAEPYRTNFAKELRAHLSEAHIKEFPTPDRADQYVFDIFSVTPYTFASN